MNTISLKNNTRELKNFIKKANKKLLEIEVLQSMWEIKNGKAKIFNSSSDLMRYIKSKI